MFVQQGVPEGAEGLSSRRSLQPRNMLRPSCEKTPLFTDCGRLPFTSYVITSPALYQSSRISSHGIDKGSSLRYNVFVTSSLSGSAEYIPVPQSGGLVPPSTQGLRDRG